MNAGGATALDFALLSSVVTGGIAKNDCPLVFSRNHAIIRKIIFGFDAGGDEIGFNDPVRIDDVNEKIQWAMSSHAGQVGCHITAFTFEFVAIRAILRE